MEYLPPILGVLVFVAILAVAATFHFQRSGNILRWWAERNGFRLVAWEYRWFFTGPFWFRAKGQTVYRVVVEDRAGRRRAGWVRCGGWFLGLWTDKAEVRWDQ